MITAGPLFRYKTASCRDYFIDAQLSAGFMVEDNADSPKYPIHYEIIDGFTAIGINELRGTYKGESSTGMVGSIKLEGWKSLTDNLAAVGFYSMNAASNDLEWRSGAGIEYCFFRKIY